MAEPSSQEQPPASSQSPVQGPPSAYWWPLRDWEWRLRTEHVASISQGYRTLGAAVLGLHSFISSPLVLLWLIPGGPRRGTSGKTRPPSLLAFSSPGSSAPGQPGKRVPKATAGSALGGGEASNSGGLGIGRKRPQAEVEGSWALPADSCPSPGLVVSSAATEQSSRTRILCFLALSTPSLGSQHPSPPF